MKYTNVSNQELTVIGVGTVLPGGTFDSETAVENPNLEPVSEARPVPEAPPAPQPEPVSAVPETVPEEPTSITQ